MIRRDKAGDRFQDWNGMVSRGQFIGGYCEIGLRMLWRVISDPRLFRKITHEKREEEAKRRYSSLEKHKKELSDLLDQCMQLSSQSDRNEMMKRIRYLRNLIRKSEYMERYRKTENYRKYHREWMRKKRGKIKDER